MKDRIRELRKALGMNQTEFGERVGAKQVTIAAYEAGRRIPMDVTIKAICREYGVSESWLVNGEGEMFVPKPRNRQIAELVDKALQDTPETFRARLFTALAKLTEEDWKYLTDLAARMMGDEKKE